MKKAELIYEDIIALPSTEIVGLNHAYGHRVVGKSNKKRAYRYLVPEAVEYKKRWVRLFKLYEKLERPIPKFLDHTEDQKPFIEFHFQFIYSQKDILYKTGRVKGYDVSNLFKLIEDSFCEYINIDDARSTRVEGVKCLSKEHQTAIHMRVFLREEIPVAEDIVGDFVLDRLEPGGVFLSTLDNTALQIKSYADLDSSLQAAVKKLTLEFAVESVYSDAVIVALEEFQTDAPMILTCLSKMTRAGQLKVGLWDALVNLIELPIEERETYEPKSRKKTGSKVKAPTTRGKLPYSRLRKSSETQEEFLARWIELNNKKLQYPADMLDWDTGAINWDSDRVYGHKKHSVQWYLYKALVTSKPNYETLCNLSDIEGKELDRRRLDAALRKFMREESFTPPGAGFYNESAETGEMWISRDDATALKESLAWRNES